MHHFPFYATPADARCFNCGGTLTRHEPTQSAPGHGQHHAYCARCDMWTWFDIAPELRLRTP